MVRLDVVVVMILSEAVVFIEIVWGRDDDDDGGDDGDDGDNGDNDGDENDGAVAALSANATIPSSGQLAATFLPHSTPAPPPARSFPFTIPPPVNRTALPKVR